MINTRTVKFNKKILAYIIIFLNIIASSSVYMVYLNVVAPVLEDAIKIGIILLNILYFMLCYINSRISVKKLIIPIFISVIFVLISIISSNNIMYVGMFVLKFTSVWYMCLGLLKSDIDIFEILYEVLYPMIVYILICYILIDIIEMDIPHTYFYSMGVDGRKVAKYENYFNIYFCWLSRSGGMFGFDDVKRMSGFSWEPGQYMVYLNYVLWYLLYKCKEMHWIRVICVVASILFAFSAMGWIIGAILLGVWFVNYFKNIILKCISGLISVFAIIQAVINIVNEKILYGSYSYNARTSEMDKLYDVIFKNGFFGASLDEYGSISNGLVSFLWQYGYFAIFVTILVILNIIRNKNISNNFYIRCTLLAWLMLSLVNEPIYEVYFILIIISALFVTDDRIGNKYRNKGSIE